MIYLSQLLGNPVLDANGERLGKVSDLGIATGEVFPRVTSLAFVGPGKTPFMISWRKYVDSFDTEAIRLKVVATDVRFSYLQPEEVLLARDILDKQIVDTRGMRVVRVNDLKLSDTSSSQLRLLGADVGVRGILRTISPRLESFVCKVAKTLGRPIQERIIAWSYMDLVERDLSNVKLSVSHKTLDDMHPADVADIIEQLDPRLRGTVFAQLDAEQQADAVAEIDDDELAAKLVGELDEGAAAGVLSAMDPDDAAELVSELSYEKAEKLLRLMGVKEQRAVRQLLGYRENTAGRIMTSEFVSLRDDATVDDAVATLSKLDADFETGHYVYLVDEDGRLTGVVSFSRLLVAQGGTRLKDLSTEDPLSVNPDMDQEDVAEEIAKYNLLAIPVCDDEGKILGIVTVDDALDVLQEEHEEDLQIAGTQPAAGNGETGGLLVRFFAREMWFFFWCLGVTALVVWGRSLDLGVVSALMATAGLPVALTVADSVVHYVTDFFIEYDRDDEDAPSVTSFAVRGLGTALVFVLVILLVESGARSLLGGMVSPSAANLVNVSSDALLWAGLVAVALFVVAPFMLAFLRRRDDQDKETSGTALHALMLTFSCVLYVVLVGAFVLIPLAA